MHGCSAGLIECAKEPRYQQLRMAALDCFDACLKAPGGKRLSPESMTNVKDCLSAIVADDKVAQVKAQASTILDLLQQDTHEMMVDS